MQGNEKSPDRKRVQHPENWNFVTEKGFNDARPAPERRKMTNPTSHVAWENQRIIASEKEKQSKRRSVIDAISKLLSWPDLSNSLSIRWLTSEGRLIISAVGQDIARLLGVDADDKTVKSAIESIKKLEDQVTTLREQLRLKADELISIHNRLVLQDLNGNGKTAARLRREYGYKFLAAARIAVNIAILQGRSLSRLPTDVDIDSMEQHALDILKDVGRDKIAAAPLHDLALALSDFGRGGSEFAVGVHAARVAVALLGNSIGGWLAQLQLAFFARGIVGEQVWLSELARIHDGAIALNPTVEDTVVTEFPDLCLFKTNTLIFITLYNQGTALATHLATGQAPDKDVAYQQMADLAAQAERYADAEDKLSLEILKAEKMAVGESLGRAEPENRKFWEKMGLQGAIRFICELHERENCPRVIQLVEFSAQRVIPELLTITK